MSAFSCCEKKNPHCRFLWKHCSLSLFLSLIRWSRRYFSSRSLCLQYGKHVAHTHPKVKPSIFNMFVNELITNGNRKIALKSHKGFALYVLLLCAPFPIPFPQTHINTLTQQHTFLSSGMQNIIYIMLYWRYFLQREEFNTCGPA